MEKTLERPRLPRTDSIEELARFWDTHDLTDFAEDLEEVKEPVFVQPKTTTVQVTLKPSELQRLRRIASSKGIKDSTLVRQWVVQRLRTNDEPSRPPNKGLQPTASRARRSAGSKRVSRSRRLKP
jgi:hypothetical protein